MRQAGGETIEIQTILAPAIGFCRIDPAQFQASVLTSSSMPAMRCRAADGSGRDEQRRDQRRRDAG